MKEKFTIIMLYPTLLEFIENNQLYYWRTVLFNLVGE